MSNKHDKVLHVHDGYCIVPNETKVTLTINETRWVIRSTLDSPKVVVSCKR